MRPRESDENVVEDHSVLVNIFSDSLSEVYVSLSGCRAKADANQNLFKVSVAGRYGFECHSYPFYRKFIGFQRNTFEFRHFREVDWSLPMNFLL